MENILKLIKVSNVEKRNTNDSRVYIRVTFEGNLNDNENKKEVIKTSMSLEQWNDLKKVMDVTINYNNEIVTKNNISLKFNPEVKTKSTNPKLLMEKKVGGYKGFNFEYWEMNVGILIENKFVQKGVIVKNYSGLF